jgi:iron(III) transport system ATP-binding protein
MKIIEMKNVTKTYPGATVPAVNNINLTADKGEIISLLGPSGCGKTTILRIIAGFERAEKGSVFISGHPVAEEEFWVPPEKRGVGMVFQDYALFPHLNVYKNILFGYKNTDRQKRAKEVLRLVNLKGFENRYPHQLSGGQQQRVALARALARRPEIVLLDEPFSNLDTELKDQMRLELKRIIKDAQTTAIFVTHDQKDALSISDRIFVLKDGTIQQVGSPREVYQYPENAFVATFVGRSNLLKGKMAEDGQTIITEAGDFPCSHTHGHLPGENVQISIRPDGLEMCTHGSIAGQIKELSYTGESYDATLEIECSGNKHHMMVHIHPEEEITVGSKACFRVLPDFVAVVGNGAN